MTVEELNKPSSLTEWVKLIQEGNMIICEFMGKTATYNERGFLIITDEDYDPPFDYPLYHSSWDWFHEAFDKFKTIQCKQWEGDGIKWNHKFSFHLCQISSAMIHNPIEEAFNRFVIALKWYNSNQTEINAI